MARTLPGIGVLGDPSGMEARQSSISTSGRVLLYDIEGELLLWGGTASMRGHGGDDAGLMGTTWVDRLALTLKPEPVGA
ncbi:MAG TPA: hypothetical protein VJB14_07885 [Planctomycetota bacterium]|nr:hypothetical protein [Planctomycetota bacterium]